ncbi:TonB-dependent siderophore receptor [Testudinibacter sp. TR-2022]|uniref:TonB-dependent siderophore receptor n=1 Tax=Testudinibacter sp. TR-2022 TaxID=2585029 RepID=UPI001119BBCD|nr:TonB-dependent siderophore receptor [Testudinibacter sp. TR-2022]TNH08928.1 TonB-dependent siderophore receptor [Pasteurellaceae bacterium Phil11]TNH23466.1 TonB-dependent siderophore receptor [Testudinibacter sp. TR-2022]TNH28730.1 TonB-dependent siderophore receptor [Testudinibacter sp. TR-2022]
MKNKTFHYSALTTALLLSLNPALAETQAGEMLEEINVVGSITKIGGITYDQPQSATVVTAQQISDNGAKKVDQALNYQAGIQGAPFGNDNKSEWFKIRGFDASTTLDGTQTSPNGFFVWLPEVYGVEDIEVVKGANSLLYGASQAGGTINLITKRPKTTPQGEFNLGLGNNNQRSVSADYSGLANESGSLRYRFVGQFRQEDGTQDYSKMKHYYFAPSLTWDISDKTSLTILTSYQREHGRPTNGFLPAYGSLIPSSLGTIARSTYFGEPSRDNMEREQLSVGYEFQHKFNNDWIFSQNYRFNHLDMDLLGVFAWSSDNNRSAYRGYSYSKGTSTTHSVDNRISKTWTFENGIENTLLLGTDYLHAKTRGHNNGFGYVPSIDLFAPVYGQDFNLTSTPYHIKTSQWGLYIQDQLRIDNAWIFNIGLRHDKARSNSFVSSTNNSYNISHNTVSGGMMYLFENGLAPYFSYSESFRPTTGVDGYNRPYKPYEGKQYEGGIKYAPSFVDGTISVAYFDLTEKNSLVSDSSNVSVQAGERRNKGIEVQADLNLTNNWKINAAYTHNHSRQDLSNVKTIPTPMVAKHIASLWTSYRFDGALDGLLVGTGVRYVGSSTDDQYYAGYKVPSYTVWDAMAQYHFTPNWQLQINATNLTNKTYLSGCSFYCYYGAERLVNATVSYKW